MSARTLLRAATAAEHDRVDRAFSRFDLTHRDGYGRFLLAQAAAFLPVETALDAAGAADIVDDWHSRRRGQLLEADLGALALASPRPIEKLPALSGPARILGAVYVLEGSRLGAAVLKRDVADGLPQRFLAADAGRGGWRKLLEILDNNLYAAERIDAAIQSAKEVFMVFEAAAEEHNQVRAA